jgi:hypothetical protein
LGLWSSFSVSENADRFPFLPENFRRMAKKVTGSKSNQYQAGLKGVLRLRLIDQGAAGRVTRPALRCAEQRCPIPLT